MREVKAVSVAEKKALQTMRMRMAKIMVILELSIKGKSHSVSNSMWMYGWEKRAIGQSYSLK